MKLQLLILPLLFELNCAVAGTLPTYDMSPKFIEAVRADNWTETSTQPTTTSLSYDEAYSTLFPKPENVMKQPSGSLSGKLIFLLSGHGWTYNENRQKWATQRSISHGLIEDMSNQDQETVFADFLWNAGATIIPLRPIGYQSEERVICSSSDRAKFYGIWFVSDSPVYYAEFKDAQGAMFTRSNLKETALARFTPYFATEGLYPVYAWNRDGADRVNQTYRVRHAEGITEVMVNHKRVGKGWVYIGTFPFKQGESGCVEISNKVADPYDVDNQRVVLAEAIRFGNGLSKANLGGGVPEDTRETEGSNFWLKDSCGAGTYDDFVGDNTVSDPPKMSARMNRENEGSFFDRLYWSFHSNASGSPKANARGTIALWNQDEIRRTDYQEKLAAVTGKVMSDDMEKVMEYHPYKWVRRSNPTGNYINYGELRRDYFQNEMSSTLIEAAFHDNFEDASLLLEPSVRLAFGRACLHGILSWLQEVAPNASTLRMIPQTPEKISLHVPEAGKLKISWAMPPDNEILGAPADAIEISLVSNNTTKRFTVPASQTSLVLDGFSTTTLTKFSVYTNATNSGGSSLPSVRLAATPTHKPTALLVDGFMGFDRSMNRIDSAETGVKSGTGGAGSYERIYLPMINSKYVTSAISDTLTSNGVSFDSIQLAELDDLDLKGYSYVYILTGNQHISDDEYLTTATQKKLTAFLKTGGNLIVAGSHAPSLIPDTFRKTVFSSDVASTRTKLTQLDIVGDTLWAEKNTLLLGNNGNNTQYVPRFVDSMTPLHKTLTLGYWSGPDTAAIVINKLWPRGNKAILMSFGPELIYDQALRSKFIEGIHKGDVSMPLSMIESPGQSE